MRYFFASSTYWRSVPHAPFKMYSAGHIAVIVLAVIAIAVLIGLGNKIKHEHVKKYLVISSFIWIILEIFKITLFFTSGDTTQALREVLPLYMCSLFVYSLPLAAFSRGKLKEIGEYTLTTLCLLSGILVVFNCLALLSYPFWSFYSLHSLLYHALMTVTGVLLVSSGYVRLEWKKFYYPLILTGILAVPAIIMNNVVNTDYMLMRYAWGTPVLSEFAKKAKQGTIIVIMLFIYAALSFLMTGLGVGVKAASKVKKKPLKAEI